MASHFSTGGYHAPSTVCESQLGRSLQAGDLEVRCCCTHYPRNTTPPTFISSLRCIPSPSTYLTTLFMNSCFYSTSSFSSFHKSTWSGRNLPPIGSSRNSSSALRPAYQKVYQPVFRFPLSLLRGGIERGVRAIQVLEPFPPSSQPASLPTRRRLKLASLNTDHLRGININKRNAKKLHLPEHLYSPEKKPRQNSISGPSHSPKMIKFTT